ncbi:transmembrane protein 134 isoform X1 [Sorex fumeus]|uniref:transmembrane protein 134 isoform X1 n=1 Tax=Sorex fumeus TaxID=62283 RepID=UPI0024ACEE57|nr:transmembrane protein 134 isoform X1 [Sorex fumeus]
MSSARPQFSIDDAFDLSLEDAGPGPESSGVARFGPLHFDRRARFEVTDEEKQSGLRYQNLENDEDGAQASPELDAGASTRSGPGTPAPPPCAAPSGPSAHSALAPSAPTGPAAAPPGPEEPPRRAGLLPAATARPGVDPGRRGTGGGPQPRCLQRHILRARLPAAGPRSLPRDLHLLRCPGPSGLPVLLPALLREVT